MNEQMQITNLPYAFDIPGSASFTGSSEWEIREAIRKGDLTPSYRGSKIKIKRAELEHWIDNLPNEKKVA